MSPWETGAQSPKRPRNAAHDTTGRGHEAAGTGAAGPTGKRRGTAARRGAGRGRGGLPRCKRRRITLPRPGTTEIGLNSSESPMIGRKQEPGSPLQNRRGGVRTAVQALFRQKTQFATLTKMVGLNVSTPVEGDPAVQ